MKYQDTQLVSGKPFPLTKVHFSPISKPIRRKLSSPLIREKISQLKGFNITPKDPNFRTLLKVSSPVHILAYKGHISNKTLLACDELIKLKEKNVFGAPGEVRSSFPDMDHPTQSHMKGYNPTDNETFAREDDELEEKKWRQATKFLSDSPQGQIINDVVLKGSFKVCIQAMQNHIKKNKLIEGLKEIENILSTD